MCYMLNFLNSDDIIPFDDALDFDGSKENEHKKT